MIFSITPRYGKYCVKMQNLDAKDYNAGLSAHTCKSLIDMLKYSLHAYTEIPNKACFTSIILSFGHVIFQRQITDETVYLMWIFAKINAAIRCSHNCLALAHRAVARWACRFAKLSQVHPCISREIFIGSRTVHSILAAAMQQSARSLYGNHAAVLWLSRVKYVSVISYNSHKNTLHVFQYSSLASSLNPSRITRKMRPLAVLQCCAQHGKTAAQNPEICRRREVYCWHTIDVK